MSAMSSHVCSNLSIYTGKFVEIPNCCVFSFQWEEFQSALRQRDEVIKQLSANLKAVTENRDTLQTEYTSQAEQLAQQVQTLQLQLQQVFTLNLAVPAKEQSSYTVLVNAVPADVPAPDVARPSAGAALT